MAKLSTVYAEHKVTPTNLRWSWSARNEKKVVIDLWEDWENGRGFDVKFSPRARAARGYADLVRNVEYALTHCKKRVHVLALTPVDRRAVIRHIKTIREAGVMKITKLNAAKGVLRLRQI